MFDTNTINCSKISRLKDINAKYFYFEDKNKNSKSFKSLSQFKLFFFLLFFNKKFDTIVIKRKS